MKALWKVGVDEIPIDARLPLGVVITDPCLDPLTLRVGDVLEKAGADDQAQNGKNLAVTSL